MDITVTFTTSYIVTMKMQKTNLLIKLIAVFCIEHISMCVILIPKKKKKKRKENSFESSVCFW